MNYLISNQKPGKAHILIIAFMLSGLVLFLLQSKPCITVTPENALADTPVHITISHLKPHEKITVKASRLFNKATWQSHAQFQADAQGIVNIATQAPLSGSYHDVDAMGLFWSMAPTNTPHVPPAPHNVLISVFRDDLLLTHKNIVRPPAASIIEEQKINIDGMIGKLFYPKDARNLPAILVVSGSSGGIPTMVAKMLASHGYAVFALGYFGVPELPSILENIPLEYFYNALQWLKQQPQVNPDCVALWGISYGGQLVLLLGSTYPEEMRGIIAYVPSSFVYGAVPDFSKPAWTLNNQPVPFMPLPTMEEVFAAAKNGHVSFHAGTKEDPLEPSELYMYGLQQFAANIEESTIKVEKIRCPILIFSGEDDKLWPSAFYGKRIIERLNARKSPIERTHIPFANAGHYFEIPYTPSDIHPYCHPVIKMWCALGGTVEGNAKASITAWQKSLEFLGQHLKCNA